MKNISKKKNRFYVYAYLDPRKPGKYKYGKYRFDYEPFYIGKGSGSRINNHLSNSNLDSKRNLPKENKIRKILSLNLTPIVIKIKTDLMELAALSLEEKIISSIGRKDLKKGTLTNLTDGGEIGPTGRIESKKTRLKKSKAMMGKFVGRFVPIEWRIKICLNSAHYWKNKKVKPSTIAKTKKTKSLKKQDMGFRCRTYKLISPEGKIYIVKNGLEKFCTRHNLLRSKMVNVAYGKRNHHHHWKCLIIDKKIFPKNKKYKLTNITTGDVFITNKILIFSKKRKLDSRRLYEVANGKRYCHRGWKCNICK